MMMAPQHHHWQEEQRRQPMHDWHLRRAGKGPIMLMLHGTGADGLSFSGMQPHLSKFFDLLALDLPGHGKTRLGSRSRSGNKAMAEDIKKLLDDMRVTPDYILGHSAGAVLALELTKLLTPALPKIICINPSLAQFEGVAGWLFPMMARGMAINPLTPRIISASLNDERIKKLLEGTGGEINEEMIKRYAQLGRLHEHVSGTLLMMAQWDLTQLLSELGHIQNEVVIITNAQDLAVPHKVGKEAAQKLPHAQLLALSDGGHLWHEEAPQEAAALIIESIKKGHPNG